MVGRQAIVDRKRDVIGYALFQRTGSPDTLASPGSDMLFSVLTHEGTETLAGRKTVFLRCTDALLDGEQLELVRPDGVVLAVPPVAGALQPTIDLRAAQLARFCRKGFRLAFDQTVLASSYGSWLPLASFITLDLTAVRAEVLEPVIRRARQHPRAQLIAQRVDTVAQYDRLADLGVPLFQGHWFSKPVLLSARMIRPAQATVIQLINLLRGDAELSAIETLLKKDPTLSFNLLRFINSSGFGLSCEITSFRHAAMILGQKNLFRWAALLLTTSRTGGAPPVVGSTAIVRGRLTELLAAELLAPEDCDNAFIVGVFSLLDQMLGVPMAQALHQLPLPEVVTDALLHGTGRLAPFLELTVACERGEDEGFAHAARALQLSSHQINLAHLQALAWADTLLD